MRTPTVRYGRAPSEAFTALFAPNALLAPLLRPHVVSTLSLDLHFRENDHLHAYCGLTRLVDVSLRGGSVRFAAADHYTRQACAASLFETTWNPTSNGCGDALSIYLRGVEVDRNWTAREGAVQASWSTVRSPWIPIDREGVLGYENTDARTLARTFSEFGAAWREIEALAKSEKWAEMPDPRGGAELDQLAIDTEGRLVLIELKDGAATAGAYYAPLQLLQYVHEWAASYVSVRPGLAAMRDARVAVGLSPASTPLLSSGIRPVVGFGEDLRTAEVRARFKRVLEICNRHLPASASPIEVWAWRNGTPTQLAD